VPQERAVIDKCCGCLEGVQADRVDSLVALTQQSKGAAVVRVPEELNVLSEAAEVAAELGTSYPGEGILRKPVDARVVKSDQVEGLNVGVILGIEVLAIRAVHHRYALRGPAEVPPFARVQVLNGEPHLVDLPLRLDG